MAIETTDVQPFQVVNQTSSSLLSWPYASQVNIVPCPPQEPTYKNTTCWMIWSVTVSPWSPAWYHDLPWFSSVVFAICLPVFISYSTVSKHQRLHGAVEPSSESHPQVTWGMCSTWSPRADSESGVPRGWCLDVWWNRWFSGRVFSFWWTVTVDGYWVSQFP